MKRALATLSLALVGSLLALVVGEFFVRIYEKDPLLPLVPPEPYVDNAVLYRKSPTRRYSLSPGVDAVVGRDEVRIRTNAAGFRDDRDYPKEKPPHTYRVVVLGDSFTFAGKVKLEETLPKVLEGLLTRSDPGTRYEVLNLAVPGYNTEQEAQTLDEEGLSYAPDLVLVAFVLNDALPSGQLVPGKSRLPEGARHVLKRSYLVQFLYDREKRLRSEWVKGSFKGATEVSDLKEGSPGFVRVEAGLTRMKAASDAHGAKFLVAVWPMFEKLSDYPFPEEHALVVSTCARHEVEVVDLLPSYRGLSESHFWVSGSDHHPNSMAQKLAAERVFAELERRGWIPERPGGS